MDSLQDSINTLRSAVIDGRTENVRHRQNELLKLHSGLRGKSSSICDAISKDSGVSASDAQKEFVLAMDAVQKMYETLHFEKSLEDEYLVKEGKDHLSRKVGVGIVAIRPTKHTRLYSIASPLAAAIAAGNCVLLELELPHSQLDQALIEILPSALDRDTFFVSPAKLENEQVSQIDFTVDQMSTASVSDVNQLLSQPQSRTLAVVDQTASIGLAARAIATARLPPYNTSPYSPDSVIVNTFVVEEFVKGCIGYADSLASSDEKSLPNGNLQGLEKHSAEGEPVVHTSKTGNLKIVVLQDRSSNPPTTKIEGQYLLIRPSTSTTDAIFSQLSS
ncbi:Aldehyde dehydrogenase family 3 member B1 [Lachnellula subtilissima]|uniref:Aldehyde dehydrogenase family 3 member B1 n=1 Tax=Lachnellula subtilissima TaxID=602034 RepID=A0A8H8RC42_9HELO|nr:Aldehyde dehydrogenase family 3 member B1 [Lachnellula subtilissima]